MTPDSGQTINAAPVRAQRLDMAEREPRERTVLGGGSAGPARCADIAERTLPKPYYADDSVTLYHGDNRELLPLIACDVIVTDPPYGTGWMKGGGKVGEFKARGEKEAWDEWDAGWLALVKDRVKCIVCFAPDGQVAGLLGLLQPARLRYYVKTNPRPPLNGNDAPSVEPVVVWPRVRFSRGPAHMDAYNGDAEHPCQKPVKIMAWLLTGCASLDEVVCDPFAGSGSTLVAAKLMGNRVIGIEREERYCEIAARRCSQDVLNFGDVAGARGGSAGSARADQAEFSADPSHIQ
jgi:hypothetical protein